MPSHPEATNELRPWSVKAINLPDHANNIIHTDAGAQAAGFERALVAGTTVYAYMTHPAVLAWDTAWLSGGGGELRLRRPVFDKDLVDIVVAQNDGDLVGSAADAGPTVTAEVSGDERASLVLWHSAPAPVVRPGDPLKPLQVELTEEHLDYGVRAGDDLTVYAERGIAHPVTWANLANAVFMDNLVIGPWIHVRSKIFHQGLATLGSTIRVESNLINRFDSRAGERALVDMQLLADGEPVAVIEHEAIIVLP